MTKPPRSAANQLIAKLREDLAELARQARGVELTSYVRKKLNIEIANVANELNKLVADLDPRRQPSTVFDPGNPRTIGFFVALALTAQPRQPLEAVEEFFGSGVYAIYYNGSYPLYNQLSKTETPVYVGQAAPEAKMPGPQLNKG